MQQDRSVMALPRLAPARLFAAALYDETYVALDDSLKTSEQELRFAETQFGKAATRVFAEALAAGNETVQNDVKEWDRSQQPSRSGGSNSMILGGGSSGSGSSGRSSRGSGSFGGSSTRSRRGGGGRS